jgi:hypothetical protein
MHAAVPIKKSRMHSGIFYGLAFNIKIFKASRQHLAFKAQILQL